MSMQNAKIERTTLGFEDHGILTAFLILDYGGAGQGFGGYSLKGDAMSGFVEQVLNTVGVQAWEELPGKYIRVEADHSKVHRIGHITADKWFDPKKFFEEKYPTP